MFQKNQSQWISGTELETDTGNPLILMQQNDVTINNDNLNIIWCAQETLSTLTWNCFTIMKQILS